MDNIVLADGQGTPANHTFVPESAVGNVFSWIEQNADAAVGNRRITASLVKGANATDYKATLKLWNPVLEVISDGGSSGYQPPPKVAFTLAMTVIFNIPARSALATRKDSTAFGKNLLNDATVKAILNDLVVPT